LIELSKDDAFVSEVRKALGLDVMEKIFDSLEDSLLDLSINGRIK
jgi:hypothetical protein